MYCSSCFSISQEAQNLSEEEEIKHYLNHKNDIYDIDYQNFVSPIVNEVLKNHTKNEKGLDFGSGKNSVIKKMLADKGFSQEIYDLYFAQNKAVLPVKYDFVTCCEVVEHFKNPFEEFSLLKNLLKPNGSLYIMTELYIEGTDFNKWYYKNDPTHVFFYSERTFEWIKTTFNFSSLTINKRLIILKN